VAGAAVTACCCASGDFTRDSFRVAVSDVGKATLRSWSRQLIYRAQPEYLQVKAAISLQRLTY
jgi:hypothetical protein